MKNGGVVFSCVGNITNLITLTLTRTKHKNPQVCLAALREATEEFNRQFGVWPDRKTDIASAEPSLLPAAATAID